MSTSEKQNDALSGTSTSLQVPVSYSDDEQEALINSCFPSNRELNNNINNYIKDGESEKTTQVIKIINLIQDNIDIELFHDIYKKPYVRVINDDKLKNYSLNSNDFKYWVSKQYYLKYGTTVNRSAVDNAIFTLGGLSVDKKEYELHNRVCHYDNGIWYDLGDYRAVMITQYGWNIIDQPPILFKKYSHQKSHNIIDNVGNINNVHKIFNYINIYDDDNKLLYEVNLISKIIPDIPHTIDTFYGEPGSSKTTAMKLGKCLIDPSSNLHFLYRKIGVN